ncbi:hypothetical protein HPB50_002240 [Hyalomma asiaticum]|uniref:Uncharacterized protein n=1 Tax=Hyalomma asiaticum TaxID=266040 RepID=A0ACB7TAS9_HYAAI|nr:hypothetical protein HPB50_002240 [Hyalomma asiaticum]
MKGQEMKRVRPAPAGASRNTRGAPLYSMQRQQGAEPQQGNTEASPTVPEGETLLLISELFVDGYVIQESLTPLSTGYTAANYVDPNTTSVVGPQISTYYSVSSDAVPPPSPQPYPGTVEEQDEPCALALATASQGYAPDVDFLAPTAAMNGTPAAATSTVFLTPESKEPAAYENEVPSTPDTAAASGVSAAAAAMSEVRDPPQDVPLPSCQDLTSQEDLMSQASPQLLTNPPQRQQQPLAAAQQDGNSPEKWTVEEVARFIAGVPGCEHYAERFRDRKIDGDALFRMKERHLMAAMNMKLGPALKLCATIESL